VNPQKSIKKKGPLVNPIDENFSQLKCQMTTLDEKHKEYIMIDQYLRNTQ